MTDRRQEVVDAWAAVTRSGVLSPSGHGNLSCRLDGERMLLTASGMSAQPSPEDLAVVRFDGEVEEGELLPSVAEIVGMHAAVYQSREEPGSVIHTHSPAVTAFALAQAPLPCRYEALLRFGQAVPVPVADWAPRGSPALAAGIARALDAHLRSSAVLLANHGLLAFASSPKRAVALVVALEEAARAELAAAAVGGARDFPPGALDDVRSTMRE